jgi:20S proteasome alpha/beta subunit
VTFIVGFKCHDGLVLCADSLEGDGYNKRYVEKLTQVESSKKEWGLAFGCSGDSAAIKNFTKKLGDVLDKDEPYNRPQMENKIEACLKYMQSSYPDESLDFVGALWGVRPQELNLYHSYPNRYCLSPESTFTCAGMDTSLANTVMSSIFRFDTCVDDALKLGIFTTSLMKDKTDGVEGLTKAVSYKIGDNEWREHDDLEIALSEEAYPLDAFYDAVEEFWRDPARRELRGENAG